MPVVISEFEVLAEQPTAPRKAEPEPAATASPAEPPDPCALRSTLRVIGVQTLRTWAH